MLLFNHSLSSYVKLCVFFHFTFYYKTNTINNNVIQKTDFLIVGSDGDPCWAFSCYGRKVEKAVNLRKNGLPIISLHENDFWEEV